jgi:hypothetical protein
MWEEVFINYGFAVRTFTEGERHGILYACTTLLPAVLSALYTNCLVISENNQQDYTHICKKWLPIRCTYALPQCGRSCGDVMRLLLKSMTDLPSWYTYLSEEFSNTLSVATRRSSFLKSPFRGTSKPVLLFPHRQQLSLLLWLSLHRQTFFF